jgi:hypothetical protein
MQPNQASAFVLKNGPRDMKATGVVIFNLKILSTIDLIYSARWLFAKVMFSSLASCVPNLASYYCCVKTIIRRHNTN